MDLVCDGGYDFVGSGGAYGGVSVNVESSHHLFSPIIDGKIQPINEKNDYECIKKGCIHKQTLANPLSIHYILVPGI